MRIKLCTDQTAFRLQKMSGVSVYWGEIIKRAAKDEDVELTLLAGHGSVDNTVYPSIEGLFDSVLNERFRTLALQRLFPAHMPLDEPRIFHSTYFRVARAKHVRNVLTIYDCIDQVCNRGLSAFLYMAKTTLYCPRRCHHMYIG